MEKTRTPGFPYKLDTDAKVSIYTETVQLPDGSSASKYDQRPFSSVIKTIDSWAQIEENASYFVQLIIRE
jgi:hypothetical protein